MRTAADGLVEIVESMTDRQVEQKMKNNLKRWLMKILSSRAIDKAGMALKNRDQVEQDKEPKVSGKSMHTISFNFMLHRLELKYIQSDKRNKVAVWSEKQGRFMDKSDFCGWLDHELLTAIKDADNYAEPTNSDPTKDIKHLSQVLKSVWPEIFNRLPTGEIHADSFKANSKAASRFRDELCELWQAPETWMKIEATQTEPGHAERMNLASRVRELVHHASQRSPGWQRVLKGADAFFRVEKDADDAPIVWLGMRTPLCQGQIKGHRYEGIQSQDHLTKLMNRYGLADSTGIPVKVKEDRKQQRLTVLSRELCDYIIDGVDHENNQDDADHCPPSQESTKGDSAYRRYLYGP